MTLSLLSQQGGRFAKRIYPARFLGLALGFLGVAATFHELGRAPWVWASLIIYSFVWPHIAYFWAVNVSDSFVTGQRHLLFDAFCGGIWVAAMNFNIIPSMVIMTMLGMNNIASGGIRLFTVGLGVQVLSTGLWTLVFGWEPNFHSSMYVILASMPFAIIHPLAVGAMTFQFASRLHVQKTRLKQLSRTDGLTGLYNRRYWQSRASDEFNRRLRNNHQSVLIMLDIDHFKSVNDTYGHSAGDDVIRGLAEILHHQLRDIDIIGRYGGEEFAVVLPDVDLNTAKKIAERLRSSIENAVIGDDFAVQCTISLGLAEACESMNSFEDWINAADAALYDAKKRGRNCYCCSIPDKTLRVVASNPDTPQINKLPS